MADPTTYAELCANISTWIIRDDVEDLIPEFISAAEQRLNRVLRLPEMETVVSSTTSGGTITLPSDFHQARSAYLNTDPKVVLQQLAPLELRARYADAAPGQPQHFSLQSGNQMVLGPSPDSAYAIVLNYIAKIPALSDAEPTNWLLEQHPDIYRAAALVEGFTYSRDRDGLETWEIKLRERVADLQMQGLRKANSASPQRIRSSIVI